LILGLIGLAFCFTNIHMRNQLIIFGSYFIIVYYYLNYKGYLYHGDIGASIHGRYLFPVIAPAAILLTFSLSEISKRLKNRYILPIVASTIFLFLDFPSYLNDPNLYQFQLAIPHDKLDSSSVTTLEEGSAIHIDYINDVLISAQKSVYHVNSKRLKTTISGWAYDKKLDKQADQLVFSVNNKHRYEAFYGIERKDVAQVFDNPLLENTGFYFEIPNDQLGDTTLISIEIVNEYKKIYTDTRDIMIIKR